MSEENTQQVTETTETTGTETVAQAAQQEPQQQNGTMNFDTLLGGKAGESANNNTEAQGGQQATEDIVYNFSETVKGYDQFEFSQQDSDNFVNAIKGMNLTNEQANAMLKYGMDWGNALVQQFQAGLDEMVKGWGESAKAELGANFDKTISQAGAGLEMIEKQVPNIRQALAETGAGNRIEFIQALAYIGQAMQSDPGMVANAPASKPADPYAARYENTDWSKII